MLRTAVVSTRRLVLAPNRWNLQGRTLGMTTFPRQQQMAGRRLLSSESPKGDGKKNPDDENAIVLTPGEKVVAASRLTIWAGAAVFAAVCAFYIGRELIPT